MAAAISMALSAGALRAELNARGSIRAEQQGLLHARTSGKHPSVVFGQDVHGRHGNFHPASYRAILAMPAWARRLRKAHTAYRRAGARAAWPWRELDCACSSDALLMNIFCHPATLRSTAIHALLGVSADARPAFGVRPRVPLANGRTDTTEVDLQLGSLLLEAKLTESGFQTARPALLERFRDLDTVFDRERLPRTQASVVGEQWDEGEACLVPVLRGTPNHSVSYQLIRGALAAHATGGSFCVLADARRPDLLERWHTVAAAVRLPALRPRLQLLTWQELAAALPQDLQAFLAEKYGIAPP